MIFKYLKQFFFFFEDYKKSFIKYSILSVCAAIMELFGVALIYPFVLKLLSNTQNNIQKSTIVIGIIIVTLFLMKNIFMIFFVYIQSDFLGKFETAIKKRTMNFFLSAQYSDTCGISFAEKNKIFGLIVPNIMNNFVLRFLNMNINIIIFILISAFITLKFPLAMLGAIVCGAFLVLIQNKIYSPFLKKVATKQSAVGRQNSQSFSEAVLNLKEIKTSNNENYFYKKYSDAVGEYYQINKKMTFLTQTPPFVVEPFAIILLFVLIFVISYQNLSSPDKLIASFALIATAIFRLTPAIARIQTNINGINATIPLVKEFIDFYSKFNIKNQSEIKQKTFSNFEDKIEIRNVEFSYEKEKKVLENINLIINKGEFIGIAGLSGAGKTTLVDLIAGLYKPDKGEILFDGDSDKKVKVAYIPQEFSLISGNIRENVAFGSGNIDDSKVIEALKKAQLYDFIENNYENGIYANPFVDSTGFSLGQRQRMAIARALYSEPEILILDEATSSLDLKTENEICSVLNELKGEKTIIAITHKLTTLKVSDKIIFLENNTISQTGNYYDLLSSCENFSKLVKLANIK